MTLLYCDSFDAISSGELGQATGQRRWASQGGSALAFSAGNGRNSTASLRLAGWRNSGARFESFESPAATLILGVAFRYSALPTGATSHFLTFRDGSTDHVTLAVDTAGNLIAYRGTVATGTVLGSVALGMSVNTYAYLEVKVTIDDSAGVVQVIRDGTPILNLTGQDTRDGGNASLDNLWLGFNGVSGDAASLDFDDLYLCDPAGSVNNDFLGDCRVMALLPDGNGAANAWTVNGAASNYEAVDEADPDGDGTYVAASAAPQTDLYTSPPLGVAALVAGVQVLGLIRTSSTSGGTVRALSRPGSTAYPGTTRTLHSSTGYRYYGSIFETNGDTSAAWAVSAIDAAQFGFEIVTRSGSTQRLTQLVVEVLLAPTGAITLEGTLAGETIANLSLQVGKPLSGILAGETVATVDLSTGGVAQELSGTLAGETIASLSLAIAVVLGGSLAGETNASLGLAVERALGGTFRGETRIGMRLSTVPALGPPVTPVSSPAGAMYYGYLRETEVIHPVLTAAVNDAATELAVSSTANLPLAHLPFEMVFLEGEDFEVVRVTGAAGLTLTVVRGVRGTARSWPVGS